MDKNLVEGMRMGAAASAMELGFKLSLERLAKSSPNPEDVVAGIEKELETALRNAGTTPNMPNDVYVLLVETGLRAVAQACADVRRTLGLPKQPG